MQILRGRIPVYVQPFFLGLIFLIGLMRATQAFPVASILIWMGVVFVSVLVHEFGHALTAVKYGQRAKIELFALGGVTHRKGPPLKLWQDFIIVLNGPLAGFSLFIIASIALISLGDSPPKLVIYALVVTMHVNFFWTILNLLPIHPLDGGHLLRIMLEGLFGFRGVKIALFISVLLGSVLAMVAFVAGEFLIGAIFCMLTFESFRDWKSTLVLTKQDRNLDLQKKFKNAEREIRSGNLEEAYRQMKDIKEEAKEGLIFLASTEYMAQILAEWSRFEEAYELLEPHLKSVSSQGLRLLHQLAYRMGNWEEAISLGNRSFKYFPSYDTAVINALCHSVTGQAEQSIGWLQTAINEGLPNLKDVLKKREFDQIRNLPEFQRLLEQ